VWLPVAAYEELDRVVKSGQRSPAAYEAVRQRVLRLCPYLPRLVPVLFQRGDPRACTFAWWIASTSDDPKLLDALRAFALGQRGPDKMRLDALTILRQKNALPEGRLKMWHQGKWCEQFFKAWEIYSENVDHGWPREACDLYSRAMLAMHGGDDHQAEVMLEKALEIQPNTPEFLNNLCAVYSRQGRLKEAETLAERIHRDFPDYFFGRTNLAVFLVRRGETERAKRLIEPLMNESRLHTSEFSALCYAQAEVAYAERQWDAVRTWADQLEHILPNDPKVKTIRSWKRR
jgi:tetratricopeptide (TPR) repeat protein